MRFFEANIRHQTTRTMTETKTPKKLMWAEFGFCESDTHALGVWIQTLQALYNGQEGLQPHTTLLYGFESDQAKRVTQAMLAVLPCKARISSIEWGSKAPVLIARLESETLQKLFAGLYKTVPNQHTLIDGRYDPYLTLLQLQDGDAIRRPPPEAIDSLVGSVVTLTSARVAFDQ